MKNTTCLYGEVLYGTNEFPHPLLMICFFKLMVFTLTSTAHHHKLFFKDRVHSHETILISLEIIEIGESLISLIRINIFKLKGFTIPLH